MRFPVGRLAALLSTIVCAHARADASWVAAPPTISSGDGPRSLTLRDGAKLEADDYLPASSPAGARLPAILHQRRDLRSSTPRWRPFDAYLDGAFPGGITFSVARQQQANLQRLRFLDDRLDAGRWAGRTWWIGWLTSYSAITLGQGLAAWGLQGAAFDSYRPQLVVGALSSAIGAIGILAMPSPGSWSHRPGDDLAGAERHLHLIAAGESLGHSWLAHLAGVLVNGTGALVLGFGFGLPLQAVLGFVVGMAVAEAQIFTQPTAGIRDAIDYRGWSPAPSGGAAIAF